MRSMKKENKETQLREKVEAARRRLEKQTFRIGKHSIPLTTMALYLCCLLCAIIIWVNVSESSEEKITREFSNISVVVENESALLKNGMAVFDIIDNTVNVTVNGSRNRVNALSEDDIVAYVDAGEIEGSGTVRLSVKVKGIERLDTAVNPLSVKLFVDEKEEIDVPVVINPTYSIVSDYSFDVTSNVQTIKVSGAKSVLDRVFAARVDADLGELKTGFSMTCGILLVDSEGKEVETGYITPEISSVLVDVDVFAEKTVPLTVSYKYGYIQPKNISVNISPSEITLRGDPAILDSIDSISLPEIDETTVTGDIFKAVTINLPLGVTDVSKTETFTEEIKLLRTEKQTILIPTDNITVKNPDGITYSFIDKEVEVEYIVASDSKSKVKMSNFALEIDLSDYDRDMDGKYKIPLNITVESGGYTLYPINVGQIDVNIRGTGVS